MTCHNKSYIQHFSVTVHSTLKGQLKDVKVCFCQLNMCPPNFCYITTLEIMKTTWGWAGKEFLLLTEQL